VAAGGAGARLSGGRQAAPGLGLALDPPGGRRARGGVLRRLREGAGDGPAAPPRAGVLRRPAVRPRRALPERDPAHDARVARRRGYSQPILRRVLACVPIHFGMSISSIGGVSGFQPPPRNDHMHKTMEAAAKTLGLSDDELRSKLQSGSTLADVASEQGVSK